jgi:hypothetical protein
MTINLQLETKSATGDARIGAQTVMRILMWHIPRESDVAKSIHQVKGTGMATNTASRAPKTGVHSGASDVHVATSVAGPELNTK